MKILVPVDFSEITNRLIEVALEQAADRDAHIWLLHAVAPEPTFVGYEPGPSAVREQVARSLRMEHGSLQKLAESVEERGVPATARFVQQPTVQAIVDAAEEYDVDLIIMGTHGHGLVYQMLIGSVSEGVLRHAQRPILFVPVRAPVSGA